MSKIYVVEHCYEVDGGIWRRYILRRHNCSI